jgi:hypothetical protein
LADIHVGFPVGGMGEGLDKDVEGTVSKLFDVD